MRGLPVVAKVVPCKPSLVKQIECIVKSEANYHFISGQKLILKRNIENYVDQSLHSHNSKAAATWNTKKLGNMLKKFFMQIGIGNTKKFRNWF